jgi:hypothetical protein
VAADDDDFHPRLRFSPAAAFTCLSWSTRIQSSDKNLDTLAGVEEYSRAFTL